VHAQLDDVDVLHLGELLVLAQLLRVKVPVVLIVTQLLNNLLALPAGGARAAQAQAESGWKARVHALWLSAFVRTTATLVEEAQVDHVLCMHVRITRKKNSKHPTLLASCFIQA
jgi:hypothetical protein